MLPEGAAQSHRSTSEDTNSWYSAPVVQPLPAPHDAAAGQARNYEEIRRSIRPEQKMQELKQGMVGVVEDCLKERGYVKFRLTDDQREALSQLDRGSDERRHFLHSLASNADVLDAQALAHEAS